MTGAGAGDGGQTQVVSRKGNEPPSPTDPVANHLLRFDPRRNSQRPHRQRPAMLALRLFPLALSLVALVLSKTQANHYKCSWGGPGNDPQSAGWLHY